MKKIIAVIILILLVCGCADTNAQIKENSLKPKVESASIGAELPETNTANQKKEVEEEKLPGNIDLDVPFVSQAPLKNWDDLHNEGCEEASVLSLVLYLDKKQMSREEMDNKIVEMVEWETHYFGGHFDLPVEKLKELVEKYYQNNYKAKIFYDFDIDAVKNELAKGNPVIVPLSGRTIGNPYFRGLGPVYHMLVIKGYDDKKGEFITNDVGTNSKGADFRYKYDVLFDSIHDMPLWEQKKDDLDRNPKMIFAGKKAMLTMSK